jgi:hypothetical protein
LTPREVSDFTDDEQRRMSVSVSEMTVCSRLATSSGHRGAELRDCLLHGTYEHGLSNGRCGTVFASRVNEALEKETENGESG